MSSITDRRAVRVQTNERHQAEDRSNPVELVHADARGAAALDEAVPRPGQSGGRRDMALARRLNQPALAELVTDLDDLSTGQPRCSIAEARRRAHCRIMVVSALPTLMPLAVIAAHRDDLPPSQAASSVRAGPLAPVVVASGRQRGHNIEVSAGSPEIRENLVHLGRGGGQTGGRRQRAFVVGRLHRVQRRRDGPGTCRAPKA